MKGKKGITLIALVITILVILILAGVTIATLTGDDGLLQKTQTASEKNTESSALEKIQVEVAGSYGIDGKIDVENQLNSNLRRINGLTYNNKEIKIEGNEKNIIEKLPATVKLDGYSYTISENGSVDKVVWINNGDATYTHAETGDTIRVGDIVYYNKVLQDVTLDENSKLLRYWNEYSGFDDYTVDKIKQEKNAVWRVFDVKDGNIRLISANHIGPQVRLKGYNGYNNAVYLLDETCNQFYSSEKGHARHKKLEDIEEKLKPEVVENAKNNTAEYGQIKRLYGWDTNHPMIYESEVGCKSINGVANNGTLTPDQQNEEQLIKGYTSGDNIDIQKTSWGGGWLDNGGEHVNLNVNDFVNPIYWTLLVGNGIWHNTFLSNRDVCFYRWSCDFWN